MGLFIKGNHIKNVYVGNQKIKQIYKGIYPVWATFDAQVYTYSSGFQSFTIPEGVDVINFAVAGVKGVSGATKKVGTGGNGGLVKGKLKVTGGQTLYIYVGEYIEQDNNVYTATYNASDIRTDNTGITDLTSLQSRLVVGGAGGNGGKTFNATYAGNGGAGGGLIGGDGSTNDSGKGGTQSAGGAYGQGATSHGIAGDYALGGNGSHGDAINAGAGGAGYYGGGGGGRKSGNSPYNVGGGGGGSSYTDASLCYDVVHTQGAITDIGYVKIWSEWGDEPADPPSPTPPEPPVTEPLYVCYKSVDDEFIYSQQEITTTGLQEFSNRIGFQQATESSQFTTTMGRNVQSVSGDTIVVRLQLTGTTFTRYADGDLYE